jgi:CheY-like chemotaxis protein
MKPASPGILIVEDERILAFDMEMLLKESGCRVTGNVASGEEAVEQVRKNRPDLILMDIKLGGKMDGLKAAERIWEQFDIPVIFITGNLHDKTLERLRNGRAVGFISKPFVESKLFEAVESITKPRL